MTTASELTQKHCVPCEGGIRPLPPDQIEQLLPSVPDWKIPPGGKHLRRQWKVTDFTTALDFFQRIGAIAEAENHHPDLHLEGYRSVTVEISTHAVGGLTENDFILAAKIDLLPVKVKK